MNILKAFLFTSLLIGIEVTISLSVGYFIDIGNFKLSSIRHYIGVIGIVPYILSFSIILFLIFKMKIRWNKGVEKVKNTDVNTFLYLLILSVGLFFYDRPSFDFTKILDTINNIPIEPYVQKERNIISLFYKSISVLVVAPIFEELFFRKYIFVELQKKYPYQISILISSICFSLIHLPSYRNLIPTFLFGVICCIIYTKTRNIIYPIFLHFLLNLTWIISVTYGEKYYQWIFGLQFNLIYWSLVILGVVIVIFALRKITIANPYVPTRPAGQ